MSRSLWRSIAWSGEDGEDAREFVASVRSYKGGRYAVKGHLRVTSRDPFTIEIPDVTVTDLQRGATFTTTDDGQPVALTLAPDLSPTDVSQFWRDARYLSGLARAELGRPSGTGIIENDEQILRVVREVRRRTRRNPTQPQVAAASGSFSVHNLRYYLRRTGRTWGEILQTK